MFGTPYVEALVTGILNKNIAKGWMHISGAATRTLLEEKDDNRVGQLTSKLHPGSPIKGLGLTTRIVNVVGAVGVWAELGFDT